jgi:hypothetical protein
MAMIGKPKRVYTIEPIKDPVPAAPSEQRPRPVEVPREPLVPAGTP